MRIAIDRPLINFLNAIAVASTISDLCVWCKEKNKWRHSNSLRCCSNPFFFFLSRSLCRYPARTIYVWNQQQGAAEGEREKATILLAPALYVSLTTSTETLLSPLSSERAREREKRVKGEIRDKKYTDRKRKEGEELPSIDKTLCHDSRILLALQCVHTTSQNMQFNIDGYFSMFVYRRHCLPMPCLSHSFSASKNKLSQSTGTLFSSKQRYCSLNFVANEQR